MCYFHVFSQNPRAKPIILSPVIFQLSPAPVIIRKRTRNIQLHPDAARQPFRRGFAWINRINKMNEWNPVFEAARAWGQGIPDVWKPVSSAGSVTA